MMTDMNAGRPSKADSLPASEVTTTQKVQDAAAAAEELISRLGKRGVDAYRSGNEAVAAHVDPLPGCSSPQPQASSSGACGPRDGTRDGGPPSEDIPDGAASETISDASKQSKELF